MLNAIKNFLTRIFIRERQTVDAVLEDFYKKIKNLESIAAKRLEDVQRHEEELKELVKKKEAALLESSKAKNVATNIQALLK